MTEKPIHKYLLTPEEIDAVATDAGGTVEDFRTEIARRQAEKIVKVMGPYVHQVIEGQGMTFKEGNALVDPLNLGLLGVHWMELENAAGIFPSPEARPARAAEQACPGISPDGTCDATGKVCVPYSQKGCFAGATQDYNDSMRDGHQPVADSTQPDDRRSNPRETGRRESQSREGSGEGHVADADGAGCGERRRSKPIRTALGSPECTSQDATDAGCERPYASAQAGVCGSEESGRPRHVESQRLDWWAVEPDVGRVAHGVPHRVDRLRALGNAVVPQQIYPILKAIAEIENA